MIQSCCVNACTGYFSGCRIYLIFRVYVFKKIACLLISGWISFLLLENSFVFQRLEIIFTNLYIKWKLYVSWCYILNQYPRYTGHISYLCQRVKSDARVNVRMLVTLGFESVQPREKTLFPFPSSLSNRRPLQDIGRTRC